MKKSIFIMSVLALALVGCNEKKDIHTLLQDDAYKNEIFTAITSDYVLMKEFTNKLVNSGSAIDVIEDDPAMVNHLINSDGMIDLLKNNPEAKEHMMSMMLQDTLFNSQLLDMALQNPKNTSKIVKQLEINKIITKGCAVEANKEITKRLHQ